MTDEVEQMEPLDDEIRAAWVRMTDDPDVRGVEVSLMARGGDWPWQIGVFAAEFIREEPLEAELRRRVDAAIRSTPGVRDAAEEDREVWIASGVPDGSVLTRSVADAIDAIADRIAQVVHGD